MFKEIESLTVEKALALKPAMRSTIIDTPEGISITDLYKKMSETEGSENVIRTTFLDLASTEGLYLDKKHRVRISFQE